MASPHSEQQPKVLLPDDIWIARQHKLSHLASFVSSSFQTTTHSHIYSTIDDIDTASLFNDEQSPNVVTSPQKSSKQKKIHFQDPLEQVSAKPKNNQTLKLKSIRSAIHSLGDHQAVTSTSTTSIKRRPALEQQVQAYLRDHSQLGEHHSTRKMLKKIKASDLKPKNLWRRNRAEATEGASSESLSSAGPSGHYHLPQDMSPVSNRSPGASNGSGDLDTPFNAGMEQTRALDNYWARDESQDGHGLLRRKASGALKYVQKWKVASRVGALIPRSRTRNDSADMDGADTVWNSTRGDRSAGGEESARKRLARCLSF